MGSFTSLESVTQTGAGFERALLKATAHHTMIVAVDGNPTQVIVTLEGSHDGYRWVRMATYQAPETGMVSTQPSTHLVTHVRARLIAVTGDPAAKVSASIASADA